MWGQWRGVAPVVCASLLKMCRMLSTQFICARQIMLSFSSLQLNRISVVDKSPSQKVVFALSNLPAISVSTVETGLHVRTYVKLPTIIIFIFLWALYPPQRFQALSCYISLCLSLHAFISFPLLTLSSLQFQLTSFSAESHY